MIDEKTGALVFSRMSSSRFPQKALYDICGKPLVQWAIEKVENLGLDHVILTTSDDVTDDPLADWAETMGYEVYRGSLDDVLKRCLDCVREYGIEQFVRVNGDSPMINRKLLREGFQLMSDENLDFVTNLHPTRTYPYGVACEIIKSSALLRLSKQQLEEGDREHITSILYNNLEGLKVGSLSSDEDFSSLRLTVDTPQDLQIVEKALRIKNADDDAIYRMLE